MTLLTDTLVKMPNAAVAQRTKRQIISFLNATNTLLRDPLLFFIYRHYLETRIHSYMAAQSTPSHLMTLSFQLPKNLSKLRNALRNNLNSARFRWSKHC